MLCWHGTGKPANIIRIWRMIAILIMIVMMIEVFRSEKEKIRVRSVSGSAVGTWSLARRRRITRWANFIFFFIDSFNKMKST